MVLDLNAIRKLGEKRVDPDAAFFKLWTQQPSWCPIILKPQGWQTAKSYTGKKVPLTSEALSASYRLGNIIGKRFGRFTNYLMIDIDLGSLYHPQAKGYRVILDALEDIGLCRYIVVQSSSSTGIHVYFPLAVPATAWNIASTVHQRLTEAGVIIAKGQCELFPNRKSYNAEHNGHRLPLQAGSMMLGDDLEPMGKSKQAFVSLWYAAAARQDHETLLQAFAEKEAAEQIANQGDLPPIQWTAFGQSNNIMRKLANYGDEVLGLSTVEELGDWILTVAPQLPGFHKFSSLESRKDLTRRNWAYRWAKSHFRKGRRYKALKTKDYNRAVAAEALERVLNALEHIQLKGRIGIKKIWLTLSETSKRLFGVGVSWKVFKKYRETILAKVAQIVRSSQGAEKQRTQLSTHRCGTTTDAKGLSTSNTPLFEQFIQGLKAQAIEPAVEVSPRQLNLIDCLAYF